jgi:hypothetical protein
LARVGAVEAARLAPRARCHRRPVQLHLDHVHAEPAHLVERGLPLGVAALGEEGLVLEERVLARAGARRGGQQEKPGEGERD